jgi:hypothetical protein
MRRCSIETAMFCSAPAIGTTALRTVCRWSLRIRWSPDGARLFLTVSERTYVVPVPHGKPLPKIPPTGFASGADIAAVPGARVIDATDLAPGPAPDVYAFSREAVQRNVYRVPLATR